MAKTDTSASEGSGGSDDLGVRMVRSEEIVAVPQELRARVVSEKKGSWERDRMGREGAEGTAGALRRLVRAESTEIDSKSSVGVEDAVWQSDSTAISMST